MLQVVKDLLNQLKTAKIQYCHWKSNAHLIRSVNGQTDLDLLIHLKDGKKFNSILSDLSFKRMISQPERRYPGMEDYLGFDYETGKLCHLHVHYKLILGQKYIKNHQLPIENIVLSDLRVFDSVYIPSAEMELLLLVIRSCMKLSIRNILQYFLQNRKSLFPKNILNEFRFLLNDYKQDRFRNVLLKSGLPLSEARLLVFIEKLNNETLTIANILLLRFHIFKSLRSFRYQSYVKSYKKAFKIMLHMLPVINKIWPMPRKTLSSKGISFAIVGADGAGKSTLIKDLKKWLSWKLEVKTLYFGIPKKLWLRITDKLIFALRFLCRLDYRKFLLPVVSLGHLISARRWIWIACNRLNLYHQLVAFSNRGGIALADRYPLPSFRNMLNPMDGPRIRNEIGITSIKWARQEERFYSLIDLPDKVFVLQADVEELRKRKRDLDLSTHKSKAKAVNSLKPSDKISIIDANRLYADVLLDIKKEIWKLL
jgi:hypothetical protein